MAIEPSGDLVQFYQFVGEQLGHGTGLTPEDALVLWRETHPLEAEDDLLAAQEALDAMAAGDGGVPLEQFDRDFRSRHSILSLDNQDLTAELDRRRDDDKDAVPWSQLQAAE